MSVELRFEADFIPRLDAYGEDLAVRCDADAGDGVHEPGDVARGERRRVDDSDVVVDDAPRDKPRPITVVVIHPLSGGVAADDLRDSGEIRLPSGPRRIERRSAVRRWVHSCIRTAGIAHERARHERRPVARLEDREIDLRSVRARRERARLRAEDRGRCDRRRRSVRVERDEAIRCGERDESLGALRSREDDIRRLVADEDRSRDAHGGEVDHAHRIGDLVDDPCLGVRTHAHADGIDADGHGAAAHGKPSDQVEHLELPIGGVDREESRPVGRHVERMRLR